MSKISNNKTRYALTLEKKDKAKLEKLAKQQNRSLNNLIETVLKDYLNK
ncbi:ribbon-helix-helix protein, CopG family [Staphylococcus saprophyticus]|nr:ribbon-helix-helix protein, CopG family [Staphylococcus saprophyticus]MDW4093375.1 ribbon-helix-helix protein, CopG family [Staphylococcus saprophyticus]MEB7998916.1 ribbon-helix-helix protein, CopG family [Staphylococcus saprophyticus]